MGRLETLRRFACRGLPRLPLFPAWTARTQSERATMTPLPLETQLKKTRANPKLPARLTAANSFSADALTPCCHGAVRPSGGPPLRQNSGAALPGHRVARPAGARSKTTLPIPAASLRERLADRPPTAAARPIQKQKVFPRTSGPGGPVRHPPAPTSHPSRNSTGANLLLHRQAARYWPPEPYGSRAAPRIPARTTLSDTVLQSTPPVPKAQPRDRSAPPDHRPANAAGSARLNSIFSSVETPRSSRKLSLYG